MTEGLGGWDVEIGNGDPVFVGEADPDGVNLLSIFGDVAFSLVVYCFFDIEEKTFSFDVGFPIFSNSDVLSNSRG